MQDVTPELVQKYKEHLLTKAIGKNHINRLVQCIKTAMRIGEKWKYVPKQDWSLVSELKVPRGRVVFHTPEEIDKLLKACPSDTWRLVVLLGADAGLRRGEIMNLPKRGMTLVGVEEKTVCEPNKACKQIGIDLGDLMKK